MDQIKDSNDNSGLNNQSSQLVLRNLYSERQFLINQIKDEELKSSQTPIYDNGILTSLQKKLTDINEKIFFLEDLMVSGMPSSSYQTVNLGVMFNQKDYMNNSKKSVYNFNSEKSQDSSQNGNTFYPKTGVIRRTSWIKSPSNLVKKPLKSNKSKTENYEIEEGMSL